MTHTANREQVTGWFTMIDENFAVPFETTVLGVPVTAERVDLNASERSSPFAGVIATSRRWGLAPAPALPRTVALYLTSLACAERTVATIERAQAAILRLLGL